MKDVCCVGSVIIDITAHPVNLNQIAEHHQQIGTTLIGIGGGAGNVSVGLCDLGKSTDLVARVGSGKLAAFIRELLREKGVNTSLIVTDNEVGTGKSIGLIGPAGEQHIIHTSGANTKLAPGDLVLFRPERYRMLHVSDVFLLTEVEGPPLANLLRQARLKHCITSMDTTWDPSGRWLKLLNPYLPYLDYLFCSEEEAAFLFPNFSPEQTLGALLTQGTKTVILKRGAKGCMVANKQEQFSLPGSTVSKATTKSGDGFVAAFLAECLDNNNLRNAAEAGINFAL